ncbi:MazG nucleotide pyrophosphohydrolase domain-containing protein [Halorussus halophilus]|uniref:MazG nucleotide pyrophosphohydrolase domain-containing protein n=1 Tax=Halorussus halophilus TaxID=2650975 RepID=UPI001300D2B2|nr:MazG nucleotide pyrophosphohydrolase domain-containing protein [Halorussus halophilus]
MDEQRELDDERRSNADQRRVADFVAAHDMETTAEFRLLDLLSELGELAKNVNESSDYGTNPDDATIEEDELGDALFCLLALADSQGYDASEALDTALEKYEGRIAEKGEASSGE